MNKTGLRIIFMGTPDFSVPPLRQLVEAGHNIVGVYTQPPRPAGRGKKEQKSAVHVVAQKLGIPVHTPTSLKSNTETKTFRDLKPDCAVVVAYGQILPVQILEIPKFGCLNIHASLLPRWRGAAPIHRAIMAGDDETGVCIMQMEQGLDTGPVMASESVTITKQTNLPELHDTLSQMGARLVIGTLAAIGTGGIEPEPQDNEKATYAAKIKKSESKINWNLGADEISAHVRGLYPKAWFEMNSVRFQILDVATTPANAKPGEIISTEQSGLEIGCGTGAIKITRLQRAGKSAMGWGEFYNGYNKGLDLGFSSGAMVD